MLVALAVILSIFVLVLCISYVVFRIAFYNSNKSKKELMNPKLPLRGDDYAKYEHTIFDSVDRVSAEPFEDVYVTAHDGLRLHGRYYHNGDDLPVEIFFHGYRSPGLRDGSGSIELAKRAGYNLILVDQRGSALSDGHVISFGVNEKCDVLSWIDYVIKRFGEKQSIILAGVSMGAATVLMASGLYLPENVKCITADCGYSSQREIIEKVCRDINISPRLVMPFIRLGAKLYGGFDLYSETPIEAVKKAKVPIFFIHGDNDGFVPCEMSRQMYDCCASPKEIFIAHGSAHGVSYLDYGDEYRAYLKKFFADSGVATEWQDNL